MKQVVRHWSHAALWVLAMVVLASTLAAFVGVAGASSPTYKLTGIVEQPGANTPPVPAGVQVDLVSRATGGVYTTTVTGTGGSFSFTSSGTGNTLQPGWWGVYVPSQTNVTFPSCKPVCAVLPQNAAPQYAYYNGTDLTTTTYETTISNISIVAYTATLSGTVSSGGSPVAGASVALLAPQYNDVTLVNNTTLNNGTYSLKVPVGTWIVKTTQPGPTTFYNVTTVTINAGANTLNPTIQNFLVSGRVRIASGSPVTGVGNVTLYNTATHDIYSAPTDTGYYSIGTYVGSFDVILATSGYTTAWYPLTVAGPGQVVQDVTVAPATAGSLAVYNTTVNLGSLFPASGKGTAAVTTDAILGNNSVFPSLGNATVRQLWAQLGLDYTGTTTFPATDNASVAAWVGSNGPFFPAVQAGLAVNGTGFLNPAVTPQLLNFQSACTTTCGLASPGGMSFGWQSTYTINGTLARNSSSYTLAFGFRHPSSPSEVYNYTFVLPSNYVLAASTSAPTQTSLYPDGASGHTWTTFTLASLPSTSAVGSASFSIVKAANLTANVNASVKSFTFSSRNVLNATHGNYTVVVGVGQNVTFSALNSTYPAGTNGTKFVWSFGDGTAAVTTPNATVNHTFAVASGATPYTGTLYVTSSGGITNNTTFHVWAAQGTVTAGIQGNWSASQYSAAGPYAEVNWSTVLHFNATSSVATISPTAPIHSVIAISVWTFTARGYKYTVNYSAGQRANPLSNLTQQFLGAGVYYASGATVNGTAVTAFKGWVYNLTLTVWSGTGQSASAKFTIVVNDTEVPVASFKLQNSGGKTISQTSGIQVAANGTAKVVLNASNATDPHNGSISKYYWLVTNSANSSVHSGINTTSVRPNATLPALWLAPQNASYTVNLTVWDLNGNHAFTTQKILVSVNSTLNVILAANNLTAPSSFTSGTSYTFWVNITVGGGAKAVAKNVSVAWYLLSPSGTGSRTNIGGTTSFYNYTGGVVNSVSFASGSIPSMNFNATYRAEVSWTPSSTGNYVLYANATATNEYAGNYVAGTNLAFQSVTVNPNPVTQDLIYAGIGIAAVVVIVGIILFLRYRSKRASTPSARPGRGTSASKTKEKPATDDEEDDDK